MAGTTSSLPYTNSVGDTLMPSLGEVQRAHEDQGELSSLSWRSASCHLGGFEGVVGTFNHVIFCWDVGGGVMKGGAEELHEGDPELRCEGRATVGGDLLGCRRWCGEGWCRGVA